ncbi:hypothetical protein J6590_102426 [Homalodisca vitripennis]|nr:hypothetical protein J6590_102426 [Homalodisca vitripennis]
MPTRGVGDNGAVGDVEEKGSTQVLGRPFLLPNSCATQAVSFLLWSSPQSPAVVSAFRHPTRLATVPISSDDEFLLIRCFQIVVSANDGQSEAVYNLILLLVEVIGL